MTEACLPRLSLKPCPHSPPKIYLKGIFFLWEEERGRGGEMEVVTSLPFLLPFNSAPCERSSFALVRFVLWGVLRYLFALRQSTETKAEARRYQTAHQLSTNGTSQALYLTESTVCWQNDFCLHRFLWILLQDRVSLQFIFIRYPRRMLTQAMSVP